MKQKTLGQIAFGVWDKSFVSDHGESLDSFEDMALAVIRAYERRKPCARCIYYDLYWCEHTDGADGCRWGNPNNFKPRRERKETK